MDAVLQVHRQQQNLHKDAAWEAEHLSGTQGSAMGEGCATNTHSPYVQAAYNRARRQCLSHSLSTLVFETRFLPEPLVL